MAGLAAVLAGIALLDSTSMLPLAIPLLLAFLAGARPYATCLGFLAGIAAVYAPFGILLALGMDALLGPLEAWLSRWWTTPNLLEIWIQILLGAVMLAFGWKLASAREPKGDGAAQGEGMGPGAAFALGAGSMLVGMPGAFPYFAAVDRILRADVGTAATVGWLLFYNGVFLLPLAALLIVRALLGATADRFFARLAPWIERWGHRLIVVILMGLGGAAVADGIGWLLGTPLLPTGAPLG